MNVRVLIIDDCVPQCNAWRRWLLRVGGLDVSFAHSIAEARAIIASQTFDIVLLDYQLGDGPGDTLLDDLERLPAVPKTVAISSHMDAELAVRFTGRTVAQIPKPCDGSVLVVLIESLLNTKTVGDEAVKLKAAVATLSRREVEVVRYAATGLTAKETATRMGLAVSTIVEYWRRIFRKTRCRNQRQVVVQAMRDKV